MKNNNEEAKKKNDLDLIEDTIGSIGRWQILTIFAISLTRIHISWHQIGIVFLAPKTNFTCSNQNITDRCSPDCPSHEFDTSEFTQTIITEWDLVCDREYLINQVLQPTIMAGILAGSFLFGYISDRFGRKYPMIIGGILEAIIGVAAAYVPWFELFLVLKFLASMCIAAILLTSFILAMELLGKAHRTTGGIIFHVPFAIGFSMLGLLGYFIRNWHTFQMVISVTNVLFIFLVWIIPESPRWLLLVNRTDECVQTLQNAAKFNKLTSYNIKDKVAIHEKCVKEYSSQAGNFIDLIRTSEMRKRTICVSLVTFFIYIVYFGTSQYIGQIGGNIYLNVSISGFLQLPANLSSIYFLEKFGRRNYLMVAAALAGISCVLIVAVPADIKWGITVLGICGVIFSSMCVGICYIYTGELYPTIIRSIGMGTAAMFGKLGATVAPIFLDYKTELPWFPPVFLGVCSIAVTIICIKLPETLHQKLPETIEEAEELGREKNKDNSI